MGKLIINNLYGADIEMESTCGICGKSHKYRIKEKKVCQNNECFKESMARRNRSSNERTQR